MGEDRVVSGESRGGRRSDVLYVVVDTERWPETAQKIAYDLNYSRQSVRADLSWLERNGFVWSTGNEDGARWLPTDKGKQYVAEEASRVR